MPLLYDSLQLYRTWLWKNATKKTASPIERTSRTLLQIISALISDLREGQLSLRAMSLVYTTIISLVPLFAISFSVLKGLGAHNQLRPFLLSTLEPLGEKSIEITDKLLGFVDNIQVGVLGALGIVILVYTVIGMLQKIEHSFNYVWHVEKGRGFAKRVSEYLSVLLIGPLLILLSTAMTTSARSHFLLEAIGNLPGVGLLITLVGYVIPYLILALAFTFLYSFIPNTKVSVKSAFIGGLVTAFMWKFMGWGFSSFVANSASKTAIYSAFASIIVFMIWIYLVWLVLLVGASISFYVQHPEYRKIGHKPIRLSSSHKEAIALQIMQEIGKRFQHNEKPIDTRILSNLCTQPERVIEHIAEALRAEGLLLREEESCAWVPAHPLENISKYDILCAARAQKSTDVPHLTPFALAQAKTLDDTLKAAFQKETLKQMIK